MTERDQRALRLGAIALSVLALVYVVIWRLDAYQARRAYHAELSQQIALMESRASSLPSRTMNLSDPRTLEPRLREALRTLSAPAELIRDNDNRWYADIDGASLASVVELERALSREGLSIAHYRLRPGDASGHVTGRVEWQINGP
jgi:type II secretory pathway component PulM